MISDFEWFVDNAKQLFQEYGHKFLAIKNKTIIGSYDSYADGVRETSKAEAPGTFIIQQCGPDESAYTAYIASLNFI